jgi:protein-S-isoprenylcysteine O-methyltransferase Ste14
MFIVPVGLALINPNVVSLAMLIAVAASVQVQVRLVEEPYLLRVHGDAYRAYAARTGRFVPGVGRLRG